MTMAEFARDLRAHELSGPWCNADPWATSLLEAISFVTPALEAFFMRTVSEYLRTARDAACPPARAFIREEASHARAHTLLNRTLLRCLGATPPGVALVMRVLHGISQRRPLAERLFLVAVLEHFTAVASARFLQIAARGDVQMGSAGALFVQHAREELDHRAVAFDLWAYRGCASPLLRSAAVTAVLLGALLYLSLAVPWVLQRKSRGTCKRTGLALVGHLARKGTVKSARCLLRALFSFARSDYHPDQLA